MSRYIVLFVDARGGYLAEDEKNSWETQLQFEGFVEICRI